MILCDIDGNLYADEPVDDAERYRRGINASNATLVRFDDSTLYRYSPTGEVTIYSVGNKPFRRVSLSVYDLAMFKEHRVCTTKEVTVRDIGGGIAKAYFDGYTVDIPVELLLKW